MSKPFYNICRVTFFTVIILLLNVSLNFAAITGSFNEADKAYTYTSDSKEPAITTTEMFNGTYSDVSLDTSSAKKIIIDGTAEKTATWNNDTSLTMAVSGSTISINKVTLTNNNQLKAGYLIISSYSIVKNNDVLDFDCIYINDPTASVSTDIEKVYANEIKNDGNLDIVSGNNINSKITGNGTLSITGDFNVNAQVSQLNVNMKNGMVNVSSAVKANVAITVDRATVISSPENLDANIINNDGTIQFNSDGNIKTDINSYDAGELQIIDGASVTNPAGNKIKQKLLTIESDSSFSSSIDDLDVIITNNKGNLIFTGGTNKNTLMGNGFLTVEGDFTNEVTIRQSSINITAGTFNNLQNSTITANKITISSDACVNTGIENIKGNIENNGLLEINLSGTNYNTITGSGTIKISSSVINSEKITQQKVQISSQLATALGNFNVEEINLETEDSLLKITDEDDSVSNDLITGSGSIEKLGEGTLELTNSNTYSGRTIITGGEIKISSSSNIGSNSICMNGGSLVVNATNEVVLDNEITATEDNNINIRVITSTLTLTKEIGGDADFVKTGTGTIKFQMANNSYTGNTYVQSGKLTGTTLTVKGTLFGTGESNYDVFEFCDNDTDVTLNEIDISSYVGTFNKTGSSTMTVDNNFKAKYVNISSGNFIVNNIGTNKSFQTTKDFKITNASLKGNADIEAENVIIGNNAFIAPGNSTGTIKISGGLIFEDNGSYNAEIGQTDNLEIYNDKIEANSVAISTKGTTLNLISVEGKYYQKATFEIIKANSNIETEFANVTISGLNETDLAYGSRFDYDVFNDSNIMKVEISRKATDFADSPYLDMSHNEKEVAQAIDAVSTGQSGDIVEVLTKLEEYYYYNSTQDFDKLKASFDDISGVIYANSAFLTYFNAKQEHLYDKIQERISETVCYNWHSKLWAEYFYDTISVDGNSNSSKFDTNVNGFFAGFDIASLKTLTFGVTAGYGKSELKQKSDTTDMKDFNFGFYGGLENQKWQIKAMALFGLQQYETNRKINFMERSASSSYNGYNFLLDAQAGYKIEIKSDGLRNKLNLIPFVGLKGNYNSIDGFNEKGADSLNLKVSAYDNLLLQARLGAGLEGKIEKFGWYGNLSIRQLLSSRHNEIKVALSDFTELTEMKIYSGDIAGTSLGLNLGADYMLTDNWTVFANTLVLFADTSNNFYFNVGLCYKFNCSNCSSQTRNLKKDLEEQKQQNKQAQHEIKNLQNDIDNKNKQLQDINDRSKNLEEELAKKEKELAEAEERENELKELLQSQKLEDELVKKDRELAEAALREKELREMLQKYEAIILSEQEAKKIRETQIMEIRLDEKPTFLFAKARLTTNGRKSLKDVARQINKYPNSEVLIEGHTDDVGSDKYNDDLSLRRAAAIAEVLKRDYKVKNRIGIIGKGKNEPIYSNATEAGRAKNRRVEIVIGAPENGNL